MNVSAIILAAGSGTRMKANNNKVFLNLNGHSVLSYSLRLFNQITQVKQIICVYKEGEEEQIRRSLAEVELQKSVLTVTGGRKRQESVQKGLQLVDTACDFVAIHDGARPLITQDVLLSMLEKVEQKGAVIPGVPVKDTIKMVRQETVVQTLERSELYAIQTPQIFRKDIICCSSNLDKVVTDDASMIEAHFPVVVHQGKTFNIKITTPDDLWIAETIVRKVEELQW